VIAGLPRQDVQEAVEVPTANSSLVEHDEYAVHAIRNAAVHFRLRRTQPTMWRHATVCYPSLRVFGGLDDGVRLAAPGVQWNFEERVVTVLIIACLGYSTEASKSAKIVDTCATQVIVRDHKFAFKAPLRFSHMRKIPAVKMFREGTPLAMVDISAGKDTKALADKFIQKIEDQHKGNAWLKIQPLIPPLIVRIPKTSVTTPAISLAKKTRKSYRQKKREEKRVRQEQQRSDKAQHAAQKEMKKKEMNKQLAAEARRRRSQNKVIKDRMGVLKDEITAQLQENLELMKENLEDLITSKLKVFTQRPAAKKKKHETPATMPPAPATMPPAPTTMPPTNVTRAPTTVVSTMPPPHAATMPLAHAAAMPLAHAATIPYNAASRYDSPFPRSGLHSYPPPDFVRPSRGSTRPVRRQIWSDEEESDEGYWRQQRQIVGHHRQVVDRTHRRVVARAVGRLNDTRKRRRYEDSSYLR